MNSMITTNQQPNAVLIAGDPTLPSFSNLESSEDDTSKDIPHVGHSPAPLDSGLENQVLVASPKRLKRYSLAFALTTFGVRSILASRTGGRYVTDYPVRPSFWVSWYILYIPDSTDCFSDWSEFSPPSCPADRMKQSHVSKQG
jgi:hypothetical protein